MPIIRITKKQIEAANKAREAALKKDEDFRRHQEHLERFVEAAKAREVALKKDEDFRRDEEQRQRFQDANKIYEAALQKEVKAAPARKEEEPS
jgi:hypothetical protein